MNRRDFGNATVAGPTALASAESEGGAPVGSASSLIVECMRGDTWPRDPSASESTFARDENGAREEFEGLLGGSPRG